MFKNLLTVSIFLLVLNTGCSDKDDVQPCDSSSATSLINDICLLFEHNQLSTSHRNQIENKVRMGITEINNLMPINDLLIRIVDNPQYVIPEIGIGGFNPDKNEVILAIDVNFNELVQTLEENLIPNWLMKFIMQRGGDQSDMGVPCFKLLYQKD